MKVSNIMVAIDFSECSASAFRYALDLAALFPAKVILLNVIDARHIERIAEFTGAPLKEIQEKMMRRAKTALKDFIKKWDNTKASCTAEVAAGVPFHEIALKARKDKVDLIVMGGYGQHGKGGQIDEIFFGSTAEKVVRLLPCPVLCVPQI
ncbi:MAG: universal stress protein [Desulfovibrionales bacterium]|nr:universal stress protein [Desulfovibrionales bacterium]